MPGVLFPYSRTKQKVVSYICVVITCLSVSRQPVGEGFVLGEAVMEEQRMGGEERENDGWRRKNEGETVREERRKEKERNG